MSSTTTPSTGQTIEASGVHYCPNEDVDVTLGGQHVATAHTDGAGAWDPPVVVNYPPGQVELCGIGASGLADDQDCLILTISGGSSSQGGDNGGPSMTGVEIASLVVVAVLLLAGGVFFMTAGKRRSRHGADAA